MNFLVFILTKRKFDFDYFSERTGAVTYQSSCAESGKPPSRTSETLPFRPEDLREAIFADLHRDGVHDVILGFKTLEGGMKYAVFMSVKC